MLRAAPPQAPREPLWAGRLEGGALGDAGHRALSCGAGGRAVMCARPWEGAEPGEGRLGRKTGRKGSDCRPGPRPCALVSDLSGQAAAQLLAPRADPPGRESPGQGLACSGGAFKGPPPPARGSLLGLLGALGGRHRVFPDDSLEWPSTPSPSLSLR